MDDKGWAPLRYWAMWMWALGVAMIAVLRRSVRRSGSVLRALAWLAELTSRGAELRMPPTGPDAKPRRRRREAWAHRNVLR